MCLSFKYVGNVNPLLKKELLYFGKWLRQNYEFPKPLEIKLVQQYVLIDFDGAECSSRWWQNAGDSESVKGEIAVLSFDDNLNYEGETVAYPTVIGSIACILKYYYQLIHGSPIRRDYAELWSDKVLNAYIDCTNAPAVRKRP